MGKWRNLAEHILQNIHVNDTDASAHTLHIALGLQTLLEVSGGFAEL